MISDLMGRRPLPVRDNVVSCERWSKVGRKNVFFRYNFAEHGLVKLLIIYLTAREDPRPKPHGPEPAWVGG